MFKINDFSFVSQFKESRFYSKTLEIQETISEIGQDALEVLKTNKQVQLFAGGLLTMGTIYTYKLLSCMQSQPDSSNLFQECNEQFLVDGIAKTMGVVASLTALAVGASEYLAIRRQTTI